MLCIDTVIINTCAQSSYTDSDTPGTEPSRVTDAPNATITIVVSGLAPTIAVLVGLIAITAFCICRQYRRRKRYTPACYEQPVPSGGPTCIVGPMEYEVSVITPYATCTATDLHQYDTVREYEPPGYEKMQVFYTRPLVPSPLILLSMFQYVSTRAPELRTVTGNCVCTYILFLKMMLL